MILGIDVSTSITGLAVLNSDGELIEYSSVILKNEKDIFMKGILIKEKLINLAEMYSFDKVAIEKPFEFFNSGGSSAMTMAKLQKFNGIVSWMCFEIYEKKPIYYTATQARGLVGIKVPRGQKSKEVVLEFLKESEPSFVIETTKTGKAKPHYYDMADAIVIAKACFKDESPALDEQDEE